MEILKLKIVQALKYLPKIRKEIILDAIRDRKVGGLVIREDQNFNQAAEDLRQQIIEKTGVDIAEIG